MSSDRSDRSYRVRLILAAILAILLAGSVFAFTATNTVPGSRVGDGAGVISGYVISNIQYSLNSTTPQNIDAVSFTLDAAAGTVKAKLSAASTTFYACANTGGFNWSCTTTSPQATIATADQLSVIASS